MHDRSRCGCGEQHADGSDSVFGVPDELRDAVSDRTILYRTPKTSRD